MSSASALFVVSYSHFGSLSCVEGLSWLSSVVNNSLLITRELHTWEPQFDSSRVVAKRELLPDSKRRESAFGEMKRLSSKRCRVGNGVVVRLYAS